MDLYFKALTPRDFKDFNPVATPYKIWSEVLKQQLRIYTYKNKSYVKVPGSSWYEIISKKKYKCENFETEIEMILPIQKDDEDIFYEV